ncbi:DUF2948 family protein [Futiania mangrovi]|uniref:DUF2948 family protein n=1 Tax=Futiania mangrovi TaxID=2959716 RepID=A0A9J6PGS3_9PROT|nr:DUF2948 family protein [Futiania mangrovii]MCP1337945.1 DUF2948 family protein [Futiania mangrovii]
MTKGSRAGGALAEGLKLIAQDEEDLMVFSSLLQDALVRVGDMRFLPSTRRFALVLNRFVWEGEGAARTRRPLRTRTGLHFENVRSAKARGIPLADEAHVLELLAIVSNEDESGLSIDLVFAGGGQIRLEVETVEAQLRDLTRPWTAKSRPAHD